MDCLSRLRFVQTVQTVQTVKLFYPTLAIKRENILSPLNGCNLRTVNGDHHYYRFSDRTDRNVALTDCICASLLVNLNQAVVYCIFFASGCGLKQKIADV